MEASITLKKVGKRVGDKTILAGLTFGVEKGSTIISYPVMLIILATSIYFICHLF